MAPSKVPPDKYKAYCKAEYRYAYGAKLTTLRIGEVSPELVKMYSETDLSSGVFITAHNPFGQRQSPLENEAANERLLTELESLTSYVAEGEWVDSSRDWSVEKGFFALGVSLETARNLGRQYQQDAVVWTGPDALAHLVLLR